MVVHYKHLCLLLVLYASLRAHQLSGVADDTMPQDDTKVEIITPTLEILKVLCYAGLTATGGGTLYVTNALYPFLYDVAQKNPRTQVKLQAVIWILRIIEGAMILGGLYGLGHEWSEYRAKNGPTEGMDPL